MQVLDSDEAALENLKERGELEVSNSTVEDEDDAVIAKDELAVLDISGKSLGFSIRENSDDTAALYLYKNVFNLLPKSIGGHKRLRTLKFFGNEMNLIPSLASPEFGRRELDVASGKVRLGDGLDRFSKI